MNVINGTDTKEGRTQAAQTVTEENTESSTENTADNNKENDPTVTENSSNENRTGSAVTNNKENPTSQIQHSSFVETAKQTAILKTKTALPIWLQTALQLNPCKMAGSVYNARSIPESLERINFHDTF